MEECCSEMLVTKDVLIQILLRLPVKDLARFKCVSKSWLSLISDPYFVRSHFDLALAPTHTILLSLGTLEIASIEFNTPSLLDYTMRLLNPPFQSLDFIGSCRGFILFQCASDLCIWNPCTGLQKRIPSPPSYVIPGCGKIRGFGYDSSTDDYLVTRGCYDNRGADTRVIVAIFSVRTNTWKQLDGIISETLNYSSFDFHLGGLFFNGANHWIARVNKASAVDLVDVIVAFDLTERVFFEIDLPVGLDNTGCELRVIGGFLSVCPFMLDGYHEEIWVMEEYKVKSSWKSLSFSSPDLPYCLLPMCLTELGDCVGMDDEFTKLVKLNNRGEELDCCDYDDFPNPEGARCVVVMHTESLLSLPCHSLQAEGI